MNALKDETPRHVKPESKEAPLFKSLSPSMSCWRRPLLGLAMAVGLAAFIACGSTQPISPGSSSRVPVAVTVGVAPATSGSISVRTTYAAVAEARNQVDMMPVSSGRTEALTVDVGSVVTGGQVLARLSHGTLDAQRDQALASLRGSKARLASVLAGVEPKRHTAQAKLDSALAAQDQLLKPSAAELKSAESVVATAKSNLESATIKLDQLMSPSVSDLQAAESVVATAQSNLDSANTRLKQLLNPSASELQAAQGKVATALSNLDTKKTKLEQLLNPTTAALAAAQGAVSNAHSKLSSAQVTVNNAISDALAAGTFTQVSLNSEQVRVNDVIQAALDAGTFESALTRAWDDLLTARLGEQADVAILLNPALRSTLSQDELDDVNQSISNYRLSIATHLADIISSSVIPEDVNSPMLAENSAQSALDTVQEELKELQNPDQNIIAVARNEVAAEQAALDSALANLEELQNADENTITLAQNEVAKAAAATESAKTDLAELQNPTNATIALAQSSVEAAQAALDATKSSLNSLINPTPAQLAAAEAKVASAQQALAMAMPPQSQYDVDAAQASVDKDQAQVDLVRQQLADLEIRAPFDGIITRRWLALGALASPQTPILTLASADVVISIRVRETDVNSLQIGQRVDFTSPALPGQTLELQVDRIAPSGEGNSFSFRVMLEPTGPTPELKPGMSGEVTVITRHDNAVLVPKEALLRQAGRPAVYTVRNDRAELRMVGVGLTGEKTVEIRGDIRPGDEVVISGHNLLREGDLVVIE